MENNQDNQLSGKELYEFNRQEKLKAKEGTTRGQATRRAVKITMAILVVGAGLGGFGWYLASLTPIPEGEIISRRGIHWHPHLEIYVKDKKVEIPANMGLGAVHNPIHTHDTTGIIHLEFEGLVRRYDLRLGNFFKVWNKDFMELWSSVSMTINGEKNAELENYETKDGDKIVLRYE